jgi:hypothetical protein
MLRKLAYYLTNITCGLLFGIVFGSIVDRNFFPLAILGIAGSIGLSALIEKRIVGTEYWDAVASKVVKVVVLQVVFFTLPYTLPYFLNGIYQSML